MNCHLLHGPQVGSTRQQKWFVRPAQRRVQQPVTADIGGIVDIDRK